MTLLKRILFRVRSVFGNQSREKDLDDELRYHLEMAIEEFIEEGLSPKEARAKALREFGSVESFKEGCRDSWGTRVVMDIGRDIRFAFRQLRKNKGFAIVSLLTISLCAGLNVSVFSYMETWILNPYDYPEEEKVVVVGKVWKEEGDKVLMTSALTVSELQRESQSFEAIGLLRPSSVDVALEGQLPTVAKAISMTANIWKILGVQPILGSTFSADSLSEGHENVVVISYSFWYSRFEGSPDVLGEKLIVNGKEMTIIGVMPDRFTTIHPLQSMWMPKIIRPWELKEKYRGRNSYDTLARLRPGVSIQQANAEVQKLFSGVYEMHPEKQASWDRSGLNYGVVSLRDYIVKSKIELVLPGIVALQTIVLSVFAIGCLNISGLTLVRGMARSKEILMRSSLGATRLRVMRQLLTETLLLFFVGGLVSFPVVLIANEAMYYWFFSIFNFDEAILNVSVMVFAGVTLLAFGLFFGWLPARTVLRSNHSGSGVPVLGRASGDTKSGSRLQKMLMVGQLSLACFLLIISVALVKNGFGVMSKDYGFVTENRMQVTIEAPSYLYPDTKTIENFVDEAYAEISQLSGVLDAAYTSHVPLSGVNNWLSSFEIVGRPLDVNEARRTAAVYRVGNGYFNTMGIKLMSGRAFDDRDRDGGEKVVIIDEKCARDYFEGLGSLGMVLSMGGEDYRVVGIVGETENRPHYFNDPLNRALYFPVAQADAIRPVSFVVKCGLDSDTLKQSIQKIVRSIDPRLAQIDVLTLRENIALSTAPELTMAKLTGGFAIIAYALTLIGIYGVISNSVGRKMKEIGIRIAIGAQPRSIIFELLRSSAMLTVVGLILGMAPAFYGLKFLSPFLNAGNAIDFRLFGGVAVSIFVCSLLASFVPVYRAATMNTTTSLRYE